MIREKLLTAYCLSYGNWTVIPRQWTECFGEMSDLGFDAVVLSFSESEMRYARRTFEMQIGVAHKAGLKVFVIPSRIGRAPGRRAADGKFYGWRRILRRVCRRARRSPAWSRWDSANGVWNSSARWFAITI